jgi:hypothetical protein
MSLKVSVENDSAFFLKPRNDSFSYHSFSCGPSDIVDDQLFCHSEDLEFKSQDVFTPGPLSGHTLTLELCKILVWFPLLLFPNIL